MNGTKKANSANCFRLSFVNRSKVPLPRKFIELWVVAASRSLQKRKVLAKSMQEADLTVVFLNRPEAKKINFQYRQKNYPTDVLSFSGEPPEIFGELILCPQVLKKQAKENEHSFKAELGYMLLHGILHLLGYDHERGKRQATEMFAIQDEVFDSLCKKFDLEGRGLNYVDRRRNLRAEKKNYGS